MSSPLAEALSGQFSVQPATCSCHCGFCQILYFFIAKVKLQAAELVWKSGPGSLCGILVELQLLTCTWASRAQDASRTFSRGGCQGPWYRKVDSLALPRGLSGGLLYPMLCVRLSKTSGQVKETDKKVKPHRKQRQASKHWWVVC